MRDYFFDTISKCIYIQYGSVAATLYSHSDGKGKDTAVQYVAYDIPNAELKKLSEEEQKNHIKVDKKYDISDVDFGEKMNVLAKIHDLVQSFEIEIYNQ